MEMEEALRVQSMMLQWALWSVSESSIVYDRGVDEEWCRAALD